MTYLFEDAVTQVTDDELLVPGGLGGGHTSLEDRLARAEEARADERSKRLTAEATAEQLATLIAEEHKNVVEHREARERAEAALTRAERMISELSDPARRQSERAARAEEAARQAFVDYEDPFLAPRPLTFGERLRKKLRD
jgi:chromosome segregation ATPase